MTDTKPIAALILDETLWPRHNISAANLAAITEAVRAGATMPPVVIDAKTSKVIDGWHRVHAFEHLYGPEHEIGVDARSYRNKAAMLSDAIALNVGRGHDLTRWDIARCTQLAEDVGLPFATVADLLKWRPEKLAAYRDSRMGKTLDDRKLALKRSIRHKLNQPLNPAQENANEHLSGMAPLFHVNQLAMLIETDLLPVDDPNLAARLAYLAEIAGEWVDAHQPPAAETA